MDALEARLIALEVRQHGLVELRQAAGRAPASTLHRRLRTGRRHRIAPRVFANRSVASSFDQRVHAHVLSAGFGAYASHETAAQLWDLPLPGPALLEISTSDLRRPRASGAVMHRSGVIDAHDRAEVRGIPVTSPALTIYSLSSRFGVPQLGRMIDAAVRARIVRLDDIYETVERLRPAHGRSRKKMTVALDRRAPGVEERESPLEDFVVAALRRFRLPVPTAQHRVVFERQVRRIDLCFVEQRLALEAKGFAWYRERSTFDRDALRGNELLLAGFRVLAFTSAFTALQIAQHVAAALGLEPPPARRPLTFREWTGRG
jgi:hypothetical protein